MSKHFVEKRFGELRVGDVIADFQGRRHVVTAIGDEWEDVETFDHRRDEVVVERGLRVFTDTYLEGRQYTEADMGVVLFNVIVEEP